MKKFKMTSCKAPSINNQCTNCKGLSLLCLTSPPARLDLKKVASSPGGSGKDQLGSRMHPERSTSTRPSGSG